MKILFLSMGRLNNVEDRGIYTDLLRMFRDNEHEVYVISPREKRLNLPTELSVENGVSFLRLKIGNISRTNLIDKGISTIMIEGLILQGIKKYFNDIKFDLVLYSTPPITFDKVIRYIKNRDGAKSYLLLKDIFPQNAVDLNMFSNKSLIYWYFKYKEKSLYHNSDYIGCMSKANVEYILKNNSNINQQIVEVCPNSIDPTKIVLRSNEKISIREKYGIPINKTIFIYGGNLGKPQGIEFLIECIKANESNFSSFFIVVGSGTEFDKLDRYFKKSKPMNAKLLSLLPKKEYDLLVNSSDIGLIFLNKKFTVPNFPSRLLPYMQASMPVLAATDRNTDIGEVINEGHFGYWCESENLKLFLEHVEKLCDYQVRVKLGNNARRYLENNYTVNHTYKTIMSHFNSEKRGKQNV